MKHLKAILTGAGIVSVVGMLLVGLEMFFLIVFALVVCTFGLGLAPLVLLCWLVGRLVLRLFGSQGQAPSNPAETAADRERRQRIESLASFVRQAQMHGKDVQTIDDCLTRAGWSQTDVQEAWRASS